MWQASVNLGHKFAVFRGTFLHLQTASTASETDWRQGAVLCSVCLSVSLFLTQRGLKPGSPKSEHMMHCRQPGAAVTFGSKGQRRGSLRGWKMDGCRLLCLNGRSTSRQCVWRRRCHCYSAIAETWPTTSDSVTTLPR